MDPTSFLIPGAAPKAAPGKPNVVDVTEATFQREVIERSREVPVVVDLWAEWCAPCRQLGPVLEKLAAEGNGSWILAKVDVDANQRIAQAFQVQGIPAVKAVVDGALVDEFSGAMPEPQVRQWLAGVLGGGDAAAGDVPDGRLRDAMIAEQQGDLDTALAGYRAILADTPNDADAKAGVARVGLVQRAMRVDENDALRRYSEGDVGAACELSDLDLARGDVQRSFGRLLDLVRRTSGADRDRARTHLVGLFDVLPPESPVLASARRDLASALF
ncbi:MAG TPA: tetratricopeptide repeat protein [Frankiaceae bacterium]|jgi:putative thioredoxin|nr:tetratricopeptide repeat protein [Frankiaceae bacterium]